MAYETASGRPSVLRIAVLVIAGIFSVGMFLAAGATVLSANMNHAPPVSAMGR